MLDWDANLDPQFRRHHLAPRLSAVEVEVRQLFSAKELTVAPGAEIVLCDSGAFGMILMQGYGRLGYWPLRCPALIRYGKLTDDEYFVSAPAARAGVRVVNLGNEPLVILRYFGPDAHANLPDLDA